MRMIPDIETHRSGDKGFTLIELVIAVAILGVISAALFGVVFQYLKTSRLTQARLTESTDQQFISTYWQADVSSFGLRELKSDGTYDKQPSVFVGGAGPLNCGVSVGTVRVAFAWNEFPINASQPDQAWVSTANEVAYVTTGSAPYVLKRVRCREGSAAVAISVAHNLTEPPKIECEVDDCTTSNWPNRVSMRFTVRDADQPDSLGYTTTVSADRRQG